MAQWHTSDAASQVTEACASGVAKAPRPKLLASGRSVYFQVPHYLLSVHVAWLVQAPESPRAWPGVTWKEAAVSPGLRLKIDGSFGSRNDGQAATEVSQWPAAVAGNLPLITLSLCPSTVGKDEGWRTRSKKLCRALSVAIHLDPVRRRSFKGLGTDFCTELLKQPPQRSGRAAGPNDLGAGGERAQPSGQGFSKAFDLD